MRNLEDRTKFFGNFLGPPRRPPPRRRRRVAAPPRRAAPPPPRRLATAPRPPINVTIKPPRRFFGTGGAPPTKIDWCAAADTMTSAHGSTPDKTPRSKVSRSKTFRHRRAPAAAPRYFGTGGAPPPTQ